MSVHTCGFNKHKTQLFGWRSQCKSWMIQSAGWSWVILPRNATKATTARYNKSINEKSWFDPDVAFPDRPPQKTLVGRTKQECLHQLVSLFFVPAWATFPQWSFIKQGLLIDYLLQQCSQKVVACFQKVPGENRFSSGRQRHLDSIIDGKKCSEGWIHHVRRTDLSVDDSSSTMNFFYDFPGYDFPYDSSMRMIRHQSLPSQDDSTNGRRGHQTTRNAKNADTTASTQAPPLRWRKCVRRCVFAIFFVVMEIWKNAAASIQTWRSVNGPLHTQMPFSSDE